MAIVSAGLVGVDSVVQVGVGCAGVGAGLGAVLVACSGVVGCVGVGFVVVGKTKIGPAHMPPPPPPSTLQFT